MVVLQIEALLRQIADEAAGEAIARAGGIEDIFQQIAGHHEVGVAAEQHGAVLAALDHQRMRTHLQNLRGGLAQIVLAREHARFAVVDQQEIPVADGLEQLVAEIR